MFNNTKYRQGFTLVEMLIVIAIIAVLSTLILRGIGGALPKSRDARRIGDLRNVQSSLELFYSKQGTYPKATDWDELQTEMQVVLGEILNCQKIRRVVLIIIVLVLKVLLELSTAMF